MINAAGVHWEPENQGLRHHMQAALLIMSRPCQAERKWLDGALFQDDGCCWTVEQADRTPETSLLNRSIPSLHLTFDSSSISRWLQEPTIRPAIKW